MSGAGAAAAAATATAPDVAGSNPNPWQKNLMIKKVRPKVQVRKLTKR